MSAPCIVFDIRSGKRKEIGPIDGPEVKQWLLDNVELWEKAKPEAKPGKAEKAVDEAISYFNSLLDELDSPVGLNAAYYKMAIEGIVKALKAGKPLAKAIDEAVAFLLSKGEPEGEVRDVMERHRKALLGQAPPKPPVETAPPSQPEEGPKKGQSRMAQRAFEGDNSQAFRDAIESLGYSYEIENFEEARKKARALVDEWGADALLNAVRSGQLKGLAAPLAWGYVIDDIQAQLAKATTEKEFMALTNYQGELIKELSLMGTNAGKLIAGFKDIYESFDFNYSYAAMKEAYEAVGGTITPDIKAKFEQLSKDYSDAVAKLKELEAQQAKWESQQLVNAIVEDSKRPSPPQKGMTKAQAAKALAQKIRTKFKVAPKGMFSAATPASLVWDAAVEAVATSVEATGNLAQAIEEGLKIIRKSDWYRSLSGKKQEAAENEFALAMSETDEVKISMGQDGKFKIGRDAIRFLVSRGFDTIESLSQKVHELAKEEFPDITLREVRDGITQYGKTISMSKDELSTKVRELSRIGRLLSQIEDARKKIRPKRSGLQRDKAVERERMLQRQLNDLLKDLPPTSEDTEKAIKSALDRVKSALSNQIEALEAQIAKGEREKRNVNKVEYDVEAKALAEQRDALKKQLDELVGPSQDAIEKRIQNAIAAVTESIAEYKRRIEQKDFSPVVSPEALPVPEALQKLRQERDELKKQYEALRQGPPKTEEQKKLERLQQQLDDIYAGKIKEGKESAPDSPEVKALKDQIVEAKKQLGLIASKRTPDQIAYDNALKAAQRKLADVEARIEKSNLEFSTSVAKKQFGPALDATKERIKTAEQALNTLREQAGIIEKKKLEDYKKRAQQSIAEYERRIRDGEFFSTPKPPMNFDEEALALRNKKILAREEFEKVVQLKKEENEFGYKKVLLSIPDLFRLTFTTGEFSAVGIQNAIIGAGMLVRNPKQLVGAFKEMFRQFASESEHEAWVRNVKAQTWYPELKASKLALIDEFTPEAQKNEYVHVGLADRLWRLMGYPISILAYGDIPGKQKIETTLLKEMNPFAAFERASNAYGNYMRVSEFIRARKMLMAQGITFENNPQAYKDAAAAINTLSARTSLGKAEVLTPYLNKVFFSARNWASVLKTVTPLAFYHFGKMRAGSGAWYKPSVAQRIYLENFISWVGLTTALVLSFKAYELMDEEEDEEKKKIRVEMDPRSAAFMKVRVGNTLWDPWGGKQQEIVFQSRLIADILMNEGYKSLRSGRVSQLGASPMIPSKGELVLMRTRNKLSPSAGLTWDYMFSHFNPETGKRELKNREIDLTAEAAETLVPMYYAAAAEVTDQNPDAMGAFLLAAGMFGHGISVLEDPVKSMPPLKQARAIIRPEEKAMREAAEAIRDAVKNQDVEATRKALKKLYKPEDTPREKYKAVRGVVEEILDEKVLTDKVGLQRNDIDEFFAIIDQKPVRMGSEGGKRRERIERIIELSKRPELVDEIVSAYDQQYKKAESTIKFLNALKIPGSYGAPVDWDTKKPLWMKRHKQYVPLLEKIKTLKESDLEKYK